MAGEQLVKDRAKSIDVCGLAALCGIPGSLFRRHVARRTQQLQRARDCAFSFH